MYDPLPQVLNLSVQICLSEYTSCNLVIQIPMQPHRQITYKKYIKKVSIFLQYKVEMENRNTDKKKDRNKERKIQIKKRKKIEIES